MKRSHRTCAVILAGLSMLASCSSTQHSAPIRNSGFLSNYDRIVDKGEAGEGYWASPGFALDNYKGLYVPPVELWLTEEDRNQISSEDLGMLANLYRSLAIEKLQDHGWIIVDVADNRCITIQIALTEANSPNAVGSVLTSVPYMTTAAIQLTALATDIHLFVGQASTEVKVLDSMSGEILAEAIDRRVGTHSPLNMGQTWADVKDVMDKWTDTLAEGLSKIEG